MNSNKFYEQCNNCASYNETNKSFCEQNGLPMLEKIKEYYAKKETIVLNEYPHIAFCVSCWESVKNNSDAFNHLGYENTN